MKITLLKKLRENYRLVEIKDGVGDIIYEIHSRENNDIDTMWEENDELYDDFANALEDYHYMLKIRLLEWKEKNRTMKQIIP